MPDNSDRLSGSPRITLVARSSNVYIYIIKWLVLRGLVCDYININILLTKKIGASYSTMETSRYHILISS